MQEPRDIPKFEGDGPVRYRIEVRGRLDPSWSGRLAGLTISQKEVGGSKAGRATLEGLIRDQAELSGVLNTLYELHLRLVGVELLGAGEEGQE